MRALLLLAEANKEPEPGDIYEVSVENLRDLLNIRDDAHLKAEIEGLAGLRLNWEKYDPKARGYAIPVSSCIWKDGLVRYAFDPQFVLAWRDNKTGFRRVSWEALVEFRTLYGAKLYELAAFLCQPGKRTKSITMTLKELRELFGLRPNQYPGGTFYQSVIAVAVKAVNEAALGLTVIYKRQGRGDHSYHWFEVESAPRQDRLPLAPVKTISAGSKRDRIVAALAALSEKRRSEVMADLAVQGLYKIPPESDKDGLTIFASRLYGAGVEIPKIGK